VLVVLAIATLSYLSFSHYVHHLHFHFEQHNTTTDGHSHDQHRRNSEEQQQRTDHHHGRRGDFDSFHLVKDKLFFYGLALPIALLTVAGLIWNIKGVSGGIRKYQSSSWSSNGDVNVKKWTIIWFIVPLILVMIEGAIGHHVFHSNSRGQNFYIRVCMSLMSVSGYGATWSIALFLIPVTKHSPILDWLRITPIQALSFHKVCGWTSLWYSIGHGYLHLRHLMDVLNKQHERTQLQQLKRLLVPESIKKCLVTQSPVHVFEGYQDPYPGTEQEADQCWLALVNATGMISTIAFVILGLTSMESFRRRFYTLFFVVHIPCAWIMLVTTIWHYPTCGLILIPNIIYYLSLNVPVYVTQAMEAWLPGNSSLVEANLIQGGPLELTFATTSNSKRHENAYVRVYYPETSVSHPFSTFSRDNLINNADHSDGASTTLTILLRSEGPFTEGLKLALFPNENVDTEKDSTLIANPQGDVSSVSSSLFVLNKIQFDSYYAGSFDWSNSAMSHDEILLVAGGVGIVPFLEFLPSLQRLIASQNIDGQGPKSITLHWYCRQVGLVSHIMKKYLFPHIEHTWQNNPLCHGRLKMHVHLTSLPLDESFGGIDLILNTTPDVELAKKTISFTTADRENQRPVQEVRYMQSLGLRLLMPVLFISFGTLVHWWWYVEYVVDDQFRRNNLIIRSHSIIFSLLVSVVVSFLVEVYYYRREHISSGGYDAVKDLELVDGIHQAKKLNYDATANSGRDESSSLTSSSSSSESLADSMKISTVSDFLDVTCGRPSISVVIENVIKADNPGVYLCGPRSLLNAVKGAVHEKRKDCAIYEEDSEM